MSEVIAVTSGKGGVGKSTISAGLGQAVSRRKKTAVILELDSGLRGMDIILGVENDVVYDLGDFLKGFCSLEDVIVPVEKHAGLSIIAASTAVSDKMEPEQIYQMCQTLKAIYDFIIIDMPAGVPISRQLIPMIADLAVIVTTPDYVSVRDSNKMVSLLAESNFRNCRLLINKVNTKYRKMNIISDLDEVLDGVGVPLLGVLPEDLQIKTAFSNGEEMVKGSVPEIVFDRIAARIEGEYTPLYIE